MGAALLKTKMFPVTPKKRYRFFLEWASNSTSNAITVDVRWFDASATAIDTWTILSTTAGTADAWQVNAAHIIPPETARFARIRVSKGANASKYALARIEFKEHDNNLEYHLRQLLIKDDFCAPTIGELPWQRYNIAGNVIASKVNATGSFGDWSELGIVRLTTGVTTGYGGCIHLEQLAAGAPPLGTELRVKVRPVNTTDIATWVGLWDKINTNPDEADVNTISGIGFRYEAGGSADVWRGVVRNGTTETVVNLGVDGSSWRNLGWFRTAAGIQFTVKGEAVGSEVTTNIPTTDVLVPVFGCLTKTSSAAEVDLDFFALQLYLDRL